MRAPIRILMIGTLTSAPQSSKTILDLLFPYYIKHNRAQIARWKAVVGGDGSLYPRSNSLFEFYVFPFLSKIVRLVKKAFQIERICVQNLLDYHDCLTKYLNCIHCQLVIDDFSPKVIC
jgi:hypothetical protein